MHPLASRDGLSLLVWILWMQGDLCPDCGHGARTTSKRWARCMGCGVRLRRRTREEIRMIDAILTRRLPYDLAAVAAIPAMVALALSGVRAPENANSQEEATT